MRLPEAGVGLGERRKGVKSHKLPVISNSWDENTGNTSVWFIRKQLRL